MRRLRGHRRTRLAVKAPPRYVEAWFDHPRLGCGLRRYVVVEGKTFVELFDPASLNRATMTRAVFLAGFPKDVTDTTLARVHHRALATWRCHFRTGSPIAGTKGKSKNRRAILKWLKLIEPTGSKEAPGDCPA